MPLISPIQINVTAEERAELERIVRSRTVPIRDAQRARIVVALSEDFNICHVAAKLNISKRCVRKWAKRFEKKRLAGLVDDPRSGRPARFSPRSGGTRDQARV